jgi:zinc transporter 1/2/3
LAFAGYAFILWVDKVLISGSHQHHHGGNQGQVEPSINNGTPLIGRASLEIESPQHQHHHKLTPYILMIALGIHSIFEGLALGLMKEMSSFLNLMISILIHKFAESLSISVSMLKQGTFKESQLIRLIVIFSLATPFGTVLGMILSQMDAIVSIVFMSLACGSFIYVAC